MELLKATWRSSNLRLGAPWLWVALICLLASCQTPKVGPGDPLLAENKEKGDSVDPIAAINLEHQWRESLIGHSVEGREIHCWERGQGDVVVLIIATIHGDEPAGTPLVERFMHEVSEHPEILADRTVLIVPIANPDGYFHGTRANKQGIDLNRNFPSTNFEPSSKRGMESLSEPESQALHELFITKRPERVISIHQPLNCIDYDGPGVQLAMAMSKSCDLEVRKLGTRPGSLGAFVGVDEAVPIITVELPGGAQKFSEDRLWESYGPMLLVAISFPALDVE